MATEESDHRQCTHRLVTNEQEPLKGIPKIKIIRLTIDPSVRVLIKDAFQNCRFLTQVVLHKHLTEIGENAFQRCAALETVQIPPSVQVIGKQAFQCCKSLVEVNLSEGLKSVGVRAFENCVKLSISSLPSSVESIGGSAFLNCESIVEFELKMMPRDGHGIEMKLGDNVFQDCYKLQRLAIVSSPTKLVPNTRGLCRGCLTLTDVYLPNGLQEIGASTFVYCKLLRTVSVPMTVKTIRSEAFCSCSSLAEVDLREGLECIESLAFGYCESLSTISLPTSLKVIEDAAFACCKGLVGVEDPT